LAKAVTFNFFGQKFDFFQKIENLQVKKDAFCVMQVAIFQKISEIDCEILTSLEVYIPK
jgi:hypothetical protein